MWPEQQRLQTGLDNHFSRDKKKPNLNYSIFKGQITLANLQKSRKLYNPLSPDSITRKLDWNINFYMLFQSIIQRTIKPF